MELDQCQERDLRRTPESHRRTKDTNSAGRIDRHSHSQVEPHHESPAARRRSNRASDGQPHLTAVTVPGELQEGIMPDYLLGPIGLVPE